MRGPGFGGGASPFGGGQELGAGVIMCLFCCMCILLTIVIACTPRIAPPQRRGSERGELPARESESERGRASAQRTWLFVHAGVSARLRVCARAEARVSSPWCAGVCSCVACVCVRPMMGVRLLPEHVRVWHRFHLGRCHHFRHGRCLRRALRGGLEHLGVQYGICRSGTCPGLLRIHCPGNSEKVHSSPPLTPPSRSPFPHSHLFQACRSTLGCGSAHTLAFPLHALSSSCMHVVCVWAWV